MEMLRTQMLACCKMYVSESRNGAALELMEQAGKAYPEAAIINKFQDEAYNRVGYTLVSRFISADTDAPPLRNAVFSMVRSAFQSIDLELHSGTHPRLGVVDHICLHPLAQASLHQAAGLAKLLAAQLGPNLQGTEHIIIKSINPQKGMALIPITKWNWSSIQSTHSSELEFFNEGMIKCSNEDLNTHLSAFSYSFFISKLFHLLAELTCQGESPLKL